VPSVQLPTTAMPRALVVSVPLVTLPEPAGGAKPTCTPPTGLPNWSVTFTDGRVDTAVPTVPVCVTPAFANTVSATPAVAEAVKVIGLPLNPDDVAVSVL